MRLTDTNLLKSKTKAEPIEFFDHTYLLLYPEERKDYLLVSCIDTENLVWHDFKIWYNHAYLSNGMQRLLHGDIPAEALHPKQILYIVRKLLKGYPDEYVPKVFKKQTKHGLIYKVSQFNNDEEKTLYFRKKPINAKECAIIM